MAIVMSAVFSCVLGICVPLNTVNWVTLGQLDFYKHFLHVITLFYIYTVVISIAATTVCVP